MAKVTNKQIAQVFRNAKSHLWDGRHWHRKTRFVCHAIYASQGVLQRCALPIAAKRAIDVIQDRLCGFCTVTEWLNAEGIKTGNSRKVQSYRRAWLNALIAEFEAK